MTDTKAIDECDILIANLDGPDPDSGTAWELGYAFACGKDTYWYRTDFRLGSDSFSSMYPQSGKVNLMLSESAKYIDVVNIFKEIKDISYLNAEDVAYAICNTLGLQSS